MDYTIKNLSVVIPVYNAENHFAKTAAQLISFFTEQQIDYEMILIDDNSSDNTLSILNNIQDNNNKIKVVSNNINIGQDGSTLKGIHLTTKELLLIIDDDFEYNPNSIVLLYEILIKKNAAVVYGIPKNSKSNFFRKTTHIIVHQITKFFGFANASNYKLLANDIQLKLRKLPLEKKVNIDKFILKNAKNIFHLNVENKPNNYSRYNFRKLVVKTLNFIFYSN